MVIYRLKNVGINLTFNIVTRCLIVSNRNSLETFPPCFFEEIVKKNGLQSSEEKNIRPSEAIAVKDPYYNCIDTWYCPKKVTNNRWKKVNNSKSIVYQSIFKFIYKWPESFEKLQRFSYTLQSLKIEWRKTFKNVM